MNELGTGKSIWTPGSVSMRLRSKQVGESSNPPEAQTSPTTAFLSLLQSFTKTCTWYWEIGVYLFFHKDSREHRTNGF